MQHSYSHSKPPLLCTDWAQFGSANSASKQKRPKKLTSTVQVNLCQKLLFLHQLTHNMTTIVHGITMKTTSAEHGQHMFCPCSALVVFMGRTWAEHVLSMFCACTFHGNSVNNMLSYCGLIDAKIRASAKDLPVLTLPNLTKTNTVTKI